MEDYRTYFTIAQIRAHNKEIGHFWFSPKTMGFFKSRILPGVYGGRYFISSEIPWGVNKRVYHIRECRNGSVFSVKEFGALSLSQAKQIAKLIHTKGVEFALASLKKSETSFQS